ncbi:complement C5 [Bombina bombina]|uniref:complement C5 n=1 Tax=Bombina bombina TaxID=8345 RepID=UPI00235AB8A5|nr:complement C5 [Bombina bombina]
MILFHIALLFAFCGASKGQEQTYVITGPKLWRIGASETVVVQMFGQEGNINIEISARSFPDKKKVYASQHLVLTSGNSFQGKVNLMIQPKDLPRDGGSKKFVYLEARTGSFTQAEKVPVSYQNGFIFLQTDKPVYTPDQSVKIRVYSLDEELKPALRNVKLTFKDPEDVTVNIETSQDLTGIISIPDFKIPNNPKYGIWKIEAAYESHFTTTAVAAFEVKEYVLPRFFVSIEPERNFICFDKFEDFSIKVKANYYYNKKLNAAKTYIRYGIILDGERKMLPKSIQVQQMTDGEAEFKFNTKSAIEELGYSQLKDLDGGYLYITASVQESAEGHAEETESADVKFVLTPYKLRLIGTPLFVKPGLPFYIKAQVKDTLDKPAGKIPLTMTALGFTAERDEIPLNGHKPDERITDIIDGSALFSLNIPQNIVSLEFEIKTADTNLLEENQASNRYTAISYSSLSKSYLYIDWAVGYKVLRVGDFFNVNVFPSSPYLPKLKHYSYLIVSKGKIVQSGTVNKAQGSVFQSLNLQVTEDMVPSARLVVYYIITGDTTAELVADSVWLDIKENCVNNQKVELLTQKKNFKPGQTMPLTLFAQTNTLVALSAVDAAVFDVTKKSNRPLERVLRDLEKSDLGCGAGGGKDNADVFRLAGLTFLTNANTKATENYETTCNDAVRAKRSTDIDKKLHEKFSSYVDKRQKKCCLDGFSCFKAEKQCDKGEKRIRMTKGAPCIASFKDCCQYAKKLHESIKDIELGRMHIRTIFDIDEPQIRSYFPESWLWEVHSIKNRWGSNTLSVTLPDSLTTWEIQGIGITQKGICVADPVSIHVWKDIFLDVQLPYSVVRGEQIELKAYVYNYKTSVVKGCVRMSVPKEICLSKNTFNKDRERKLCTAQDFMPSSVKVFTFTVLPLELGLHTMNFTLNAEFNNEIVVKTLRVVPEGIKKERNAAFTLDPQGIHGTVRKRHEINYRVPANIVPKSKVDRTLSVKGHLLGEIINTVLNSEEVNFLTSLPQHNAETELMRVVPIFYVYHYLQTMDSWDILGPNPIASKTQLERKMKEGVSSLLAFRNRDFSYSVWRDSEPSTWLTAFAMRIFGEIQNYVSVDHMSVCNSLLWLVKNSQLGDGSFKDNSHYQPIMIKDNVAKEYEKKMYLTAFVLIGFQKTYRMCPLAELTKSINLAKEYLSKNVPTAQSTYSVAIAAYALALTDVKFTSTRHAYQILQKEANVIGIGNPPVYRFWKESLNKFDATVPNAATAQMVETTAYAIMTCAKLGDLDYCNPAVRWLSEQQRYGGGFFSTQDTALALEALTEVAISNRKLTLDMTVTVNYRKSGDFQKYLLTAKSPLTNPAEVPIPDDLIISTGSTYGIATARVRTVYHLISTSDEICSFELTIERKTDTSERTSVFDEDMSNIIRLEACAKYKASEFSSSGHAVMEISLVSGLEVDEQELASLVTRVDQYVTDYSIKDGRVILHFDSIPSDEFVCVMFPVMELYKVERLSPATFSVYEFHAPDKRCTIFYNPYEDQKLVQVCTGQECKCVEGECAKMQSSVDLSISANDRRDTACKNDIVYAYKVEIVGSEVEANFVKYSAIIKYIFKKAYRY